MSGGTLISLAADEIVMSENAVLGPVDPQLGEYPAASVLKLKEIKNVDNIDDKTLIMADIAEKAIKQIENSVTELLSGNYDDNVAKKLGETLSRGKWTHDYPITYEEAKELGLKVSHNIPVEIIQLMSLYPQPIKKLPSVEYLPFPRHKA